MSIILVAGRFQILEHAVTKQTSATEDFIKTLLVIVQQFFELREIVNGRLQDGPKCLGHALLDCWFKAGLGKDQPRSVATVAADKWDCQQRIGGLLSDDQNRD